MDGVNEVGEVKVSRLQMEGESDDKTPPEHKCPALCDCLHGSVHDRENSPMMRAVLCAQVCKVYRFQTEDQRWLLVREQMSETPLSFSLPKQLLKTLIHQHTSRVQEVKELGDLSPHWDGLRHDVINHCNHLLGCYQETLTELDKLSGVWYDVITFGAPTDHHQAFKHGGLKRLLHKHTNHRDSSISYSQEESSRARELLASVAQLQPLVFGLAEELLSVSLELNTSRLLQVLDSLAQQTEQFVHALKDELVKNALLAIHKQYSAHCNNSSHVHSNGLLCDNSPANQEGRPSLHKAEYDEEEWDRTWANVAKSLNCIFAMVDRIKGREDRPPEMTSSEQQEATGDTNSQNTASSSSPSTPSWQEQLLPLVVTLRDCVREAVGKARVAMTFVVLQGAVAATIAQGPVQLVQRHHAVFSQAVRDRERDAVFGDSSLQERVNQQSCERLKAYCYTLRDRLPEMAGVQSLSDLLSSLDRSVEARKRKNVEVLWIAAMVCRKVNGVRLTSCKSAKDRTAMSVTLEQCVLLRERHALSQQHFSTALDCMRRSRLSWGQMLGCYSPSGLTVSGLDAGEQPSGLQSSWLPQSLAPKAPRRHLYPVAFLLVTSHLLVLWLILSLVILLAKYQEGCRMENVQKNVGNRKFAFSSVQLLTFPKLYRPPDGSYG
eukprot:superscaffoldBa00005507_g20431